MIGLLRRPWARAGSGALTAALVLGGIVLIGNQGANPAQNMRLLSGAAWLASGRVGQVTLLDGSSAEVSAQVQVAPVGDVLQLAQQDSDVYAVDQSAGTIRRVDGATFDAGPPQRPIDGAGAGLMAFAGPKSLYALDTRRGLVTGADPKTGSALSEPRSMAAQVAPGTAGVDDGGRLWIVDNSSGDLYWTDGGIPNRRAKAVEPGRSLLTIANGRPVVVDTTGRRAFTVDPDSGSAGAPIDLDVRPNEEIQVSGSSHGDRVYVVTPRGVLTICDLAEKSCGKVVPLADATSRLGAAVEAGNRVFVPDYTTGQVWVVDFAAAKVVAQPKVLDTAKQFQLINRDGQVFYNDPDTDQAGVIKLDGSVQPTSKYDPADPNKGLNKPVSGAPATQQGSSSAPSQSGGSQAPDTQSSAPTAPSVTIPVPPPPPPPPPPSSTSEQPPPPPPSSNEPPPKPAIAITPSKASPVVNEQITLRVADTNGATVTSATWSFGDGQTATGLMVPHKWDTARPYQVSVQAKMSDGQDAGTSRTIEVTTPPDSTVPVVLGQTQGEATNAITAANLRVAAVSAQSNTVPQGHVITQNPAGGGKAPAQSIVTITVSSGKPPKIDLLATAGSAQWRSSWGPLSYDGNDGDNHGFVKPRSGWVMEDGSAPPFLETHPEWVANGFTEGTYTLSRQIMAGDHFRVTVGFMAVQSPPSKGDGTFVVSVIRPNGAAQVLKSLHDSGSDGVMRPIDVDLTPFAGSTKFRLHVDAGPDSSQDWMSWVAPRIEG
ncbi:PASTA domain-containing protein [Actinocrispum wychmicini]|uniref:PKD domain-containing protein n=1 Tax=Actinocrispum wychmicini TaxID=1213861 RepID=A0A4R2JEE8_9PSEU|nr:PASTA domain-containing protein [Actinocrispum wychmicini]TCO55208.1 PKD domain-containing protein [Actinocrispum wychmicini]